MLRNRYKRTDLFAISPSSNRVSSPEAVLDFSSVASSRYGMNTLELKPYPSDISDDELQLLLPNLLLIREDSPAKASLI